MKGFSVLTLVKGRAAHLPFLIDALRRSRMAPLELIVGAMGTERLQADAQDFPLRVVDMVTADGALPLSKARNRAASAASGDVLLFLDVDVMVSRNVLADAASLLDQRDELVCPEVRYLCAPVTQEWTQEALAEAGVAHPARPFPAHGWREEPHAGLLWSLAFAVRAATFHAIGGFDENFTGYGAEDTDFGFRARARGTKLLFLGGCPVFHQCHEVYHPPLQHFADIVENARRFQARWGIWPMDGWLAAFAARGLIAWAPEAAGIDILRPPTRLEIDAARQLPGTPF